MLYTEDVDALKQIRELRMYCREYIGEDWVETLENLQRIIEEKGRVQD